MTPDDLDNLRDALGISSARLAAELGIDRKTLRRMDLGEKAIPRGVALACAALNHGLAPFGEVKKKKKGKKP